jgi:hypothetical protein
MRTFYVRLDNIFLKEDSKKGHIAMEASSGPELLQRACDFFGWKETPAIHLELWTSCHGSKIRVDHLLVIPDEFEFVNLRAVYSSSS